MITIYRMNCDEQGTRRVWRGGDNCQFPKGQFSGLGKLPRYFLISGTRCYAKNVISNADLAMIGKNQVSSQFFFPDQFLEQNLEKLFVNGFLLTKNSFRLKKGEFVVFQRSEREHFLSWHNFPYSILHIQSKRCKIQTKIWTHFSMFQKSN